MRKRRKKKAIKKLFTGLPLTLLELRVIRREIGPVAGLVPVGRGMVKVAAHEVEQALELGREMGEAASRTRRFESEIKEQ